MITDILFAAREAFTLRDSQGEPKFLHEAAQAAWLPLPVPLRNPTHCAGVRRGPRLTLQRAPLRTRCQEPDSFARLTDSVLDAIWMSTQEGLEEVRRLIG